MRPLGQLDQQGIARGMSVPVVDLLEPVEIDSNQRNLVVGPDGSGDFDLDKLRERCVIGEAGHLVMAIA